MTPTVLTVFTRASTSASNRFPRVSFIILSLSNTTVVRTSRGAGGCSEPKSAQPPPSWLYCTHADCLHRLPWEPLVHEELRLAPMFNLVVPAPLAHRHHLPINLVQRRQIIEVVGVGHLSVSIRECPRAPCRHSGPHTRH